MGKSHVISMDSAGRLVVPKALRDELGALPGEPLTALVRDGRLEIAQRDIAADLVENDGLLTIVPTEPVPALSRDSVRELLENLRK